MSSVSESTITAATRREPILICSDDSAEAVRAIEMAAAESMAATSSVVPRNAFEALNVIVIGSRGLAGVKKIFDASVSEQVAEHAGRPVLIVPPPR